MRRCCAKRALRCEPAPKIKYNNNKNTFYIINAFIQYTYLPIYTLYRCTCSRLRVGIPCPSIYGILHVAGHTTLPPSLIRQFYCPVTP